MVKKWYKPKGRSAVMLEEEEIVKLIEKRTDVRFTEAQPKKTIKKKVKKKIQEEDKQWQ